MGTDFKCGCRNHIKGWDLCERHEDLMLTQVEVYDGDN